MTCRRQSSSIKRTATYSLLLALLIISSAIAAPATTPDLPKHDKLILPDVRTQTGTIVPGKYLVQFSRPPAANVAAQRRERASQQSLEQGAQEQQESFGVYCRRNRIPVKVNRRYVKLFNGVSANVESVDDLKKVLDAPGVVKVFPVVQQFAPEQPQIIKDPVLPQFAHNLTNMHLVSQKYPDLTGRNVKVGVIDSGIDWKHPAFAVPGQKCESFKGPGCRVLYGYDFVGDAYDSRNRSAPAVPDADPLDCGGHGTHVAGIIGGYDDKIKGVAPEAVFGAYRVFGCDGTTDNAIIMAALELSFQDGMELINMSLGGAHIGADSPYAQAIDTLVTNGVHVIAAGSNSGENGLSWVTAPSIASKAFSIASFDNTHNYETAAELTNVPNLTSVTFGYSTSNGITGRFEQDKKAKLIRSPNPPTADTDGCSPFPANHFAGGVALVRRGGCAFTDKAAAAFAAGAAGVVVYNNKPAALSGGVLDAAKIGNRPVGFIAGDDGEKIWNAAGAGAVEITFNNQPEFRRSRTSGLPSGFSSWGLDVNLRIRPDVGAPGGNIYSAYPIKKGSYAQLSGTSMASPYVAGIVALEVQRNGASTGEASSLDILRRLSLTARPSMMPDGTPVAESVAKTGAGMIDALAFLENPISVTPHKLELGDTPNWPRAPVKTQTITIKNNGKERVTYRLTHTPSRAIMGDNGRTTEQFVTLSNVHSRVTFSTPSVTLQPGEEKQVTVSINANVPLLSKLPEPGHYIYSGFVTLQTADRKSDLSVPYAVMVGDYGTMPVIPASGPLAPALTNGLYLSPATTATAPTYNASRVPEFSLDMDDLSEIPVIRFGTVFPTRKFAISVHNATAPGSPVVGYLFSNDHVSRLANQNGGPITQSYIGLVQASLTSTARTMLPEGEYTIGLQYVRPAALTPVANADAALIQGWMSPKFRINRAKRPNRRPQPPTGGSNEAPIDVQPAPGVEQPPVIAKN